MKAIVKTKESKGFEWKDVVEPNITKPDQVKIKTLKSSVCGTDYHIYKWDEWSQSQVRIPHINGHEVLAEIVEVGDQVKGFKVGEVIACETHIYCSTCYQCRTGNAHVCENMSILGVHQDGIWAEFQVVPQNILWKLDGIEHRYAAIMEPLGNAIHTLSYSEVRGRHVLIIGAGPIGIMAAYVAYISGAATVTVSEVNQYRIDMLSKFDININIINPIKINLESEIMKITDSHGIDVMCEMSGNDKALRQGLNIMTSAGDVNILALYPKSMIELPINDLVFKNLKFQFVTGRKLFDTWSVASQWLKQGRLTSKNLNNILTHVFKAEDFEDVFKIMEENKCGKIVLDFTYLNKKN